MGVKETFATRLKKLRGIAELSQEQLADKLKVSRGSIGYYENTGRVPDIEFLDRTATLFGVSFDYLMGYSDNMNKDYEDIGGLTGLSDPAIDVVYRYSDVLNTIFETPDITIFLSNVEMFFDLEKCKIQLDCGIYDLDSESGYISFILAKLFIDVLVKSRKSVFFNSLSESEVKKKLEIIDKSIKERSEKINKIIEKSIIKADEDHNAMIHSDEYKIHHKIHDYIYDSKAGDTNGNDSETE